MAWTGRGERMDRRTRVERCARHAVIVVMAGIALAAQATAADVRVNSPPSDFITEGNVRRVLVTLNKSLTIQIKRPFGRAIVGSADIADVLPTSDRTLYIQGKKAGTTDLSVFDDSGRLMGILDVEVALPRTGNRHRRVRG